MGLPHTDGVLRLLLNLGLLVCAGCLQQLLKLRKRLIRLRRGAVAEQRSHGLFGFHGASCRKVTLDPTYEAWCHTLR